METKAVWTLLHQAIGENRNREMISLLKKYSVEFILEGTYNDFCSAEPHIKESCWKRLIELRNRFSLNLRKEWLIRNDIRVISYHEESYPPLLKHIYDPPALLYLKGELNLESLHIALVGSRKSTQYGKSVAKELAQQLSLQNAVVVSGLARGIDAQSHLGALEEHGGTVAVLGTGIDKLYPRENKQLYDSIISHSRSAIMTAFPLGEPPLPFHFPRRNRIIAGLSDGVVVVEAANKSGALITAHLALENGRDVFAVPGMITSPQSVGCLRLIKDGAKMIVDVNDILEEYGQLTLFDDKKHQEQFTPEEQEVLDVLSIEPVSLEDIALQLNRPVNEISSLLSILEITGAVKQLVGRSFIKVY